MLQWWVVCQWRRAIQLLNNSHRQPGAGGGRARGGGEEIGEGTEWERERE